ncbi:KDM8 [Branchiostoma lanceolatum]|uniref:KDM8 protein n=1 Tax=Branchiostoma lanceolatum TaxID=7740 RepID=A0A8J9W2L8_BRALA|nr:KDM8 [Branchiostoma lanceolatum]
MAWNFESKLVEIKRADGMTPDVFTSCYRNRHPIILTDIVSTWKPIRAWNPAYISQALAQVKEKWTVFVAHDNQHFLNHPEITKKLEMTPEELVASVFRTESAQETALKTSCGKENMSPGTSKSDTNEENMTDKCTTDISTTCEQEEKRRYYLRSFSMPDPLFQDIFIHSQAKRLLDSIYQLANEQFLSEQDDWTESESKDISEEFDKLAVRKFDGHEKDNHEVPSCGQSCSLERVQEEAGAETCDSNDRKQSAILEEVADGQPREALQYSDHEEEGAGESCQMHTDMADSSFAQMKLPTRFEIGCKRIFNQNTMQLWLGSAGNITPLHYDRNHGLLSQIVGCKELVLFSHEDTNNLYPYSSLSDRSHTSRVNLRTTDREEIERFPRVAEAQRYHCVLKPGELLYIPPFWWHDVTSLDPCVSVTLPWDLEAHEDIPACMWR